jgi:hypothetical protein
MICRARNMLLAAFLDRGADWLYFWDDDIETENVGGDAGNLLDMLLSHGAPFVGGLYSTRGEGAHCASRAIEQRADRRLWPMRYLAGGSILVSRDAVERMIAEYPELAYQPGHNEALQSTAYALFQPMIYNGEYLSEDFAFCQRWRDCGGPVFADLDVRLNHWGEAAYALKDPRTA